MPQIWVRHSLGITMQLLPPQLYRYRSVDGPDQARTQRIIETGLHYFASPTSFNDPFDCRPNFALDSDENSVREYLYGMWARRAPHMSEDARKQEVDAILQDPARDPRIPENNMIFAAVYDSLVTARIGVLCLSEVKDSILMWSHYADCHRGICLVYDTDNEFFVHAQPVQYQRERPRVNPVIHSNEQMLDSAIFTKSEAWAYEKEWRIIHYQHGSGERQSPHACLKAIIVGLAMSGTDRRLVESWAKASPAKPAVIRTNLSPSEFSIVFPKAQ